METMFPNSLEIGDSDSAGVTDIVCLGIGLVALVICQGHAKPIIDACNSHDQLVVENAALREQLARKDDVLKTTANAVLSTGEAARAGIAGAQPSMPPMGSTIQLLGARLADLLDEDQFADCESLLLKIAAEVMPQPPETDAASFKNFHRALCDRFNYTHDDQFWWRDQVSLIEHIAASLPQPAAPDPVREQLVAALRKIAKADRGEGGCYYTNRNNIGIAADALKAAGAIP